VRVRIVKSPTCARVCVWVCHCGKKLSANGAFSKTGPDIVSRLRIVDNPTCACACVCIMRIYAYICVCVCVCICYSTRTHDRKETHVCVWIIYSPTCACACVRLCAHMQFLFVCADYLVVSPVSVSCSVLFLLLSLHGAVCWCAHEAICVGSVVISQTITEAQDAALSSLDQYIHSRARAHTHAHAHTHKHSCAGVCVRVCVCVDEPRELQAKLPDHFLRSNQSNFIIKATVRLTFCKNLLLPSRGTYSLQCTSVVNWCWIRFQ